MSSPLVSVKENDYLDTDPPLRGQNFVCLSFISPEDVIKKKEVFLFENFIRFFTKELREFFDNLSMKYKDEADVIKHIKDRYSYLFDDDAIRDEYHYFLTKNNEQLEKEYLEKNNFQTTIRGIKVRGTFDTIREAEVRAQVLKRIDDRFHVYVAEVGCWCPWSPHPDDISNQEYAETQLNTLMKGYKENQEKRDAFYQERKREMQSFKKEQPKADPDAATDTVQEVAEETPEAPQEITVTETVERVDAEDPWMQRKRDETETAADAV